MSDSLYTEMSVEKQYLRETLAVSRGFGALAASGRRGRTTRG